MPEGIGVRGQKSLKTAGVYDLDRVKFNHHAKYPVQGSSCSSVAMRTYTRSHTQYRPNAVFGLLSGRKIRQ